MNAQHRKASQWSTPMVLLATVLTAACETEGAKYVLMAAGKTMHLEDRTRPPALQTQNITDLENFTDASASDCTESNGVIVSTSPITPYAAVDQPVPRGSFTQRIDTTSSGQVDLAQGTVSLTVLQGISSTAKSSYVVGRLQLYQLYFADCRDSSCCGDKWAILVLFAMVTLLCCAALLLGARCARKHETVQGNRLAFRSQ